MALQTSVEQVDGPTPATVVALDGELDGASFEGVIDTVRDLYAAGTRHLVLDLSGLTFISSSGLRAGHGAMGVPRGEGAPAPPRGSCAARAPPTPSTVGRHSARSATRSTRAASSRTCTCAGRRRRCR